MTVQQEAQSHSVEIRKMFNTLLCSFIRNINVAAHDVTEEVFIFKIKIRICSSALHVFSFANQSIINSLKDHMGRRKSNFL